MADPYEFKDKYGDDEQFSLFQALVCLYNGYSQCDIDVYETTLPECKYDGDQPTYGTCEERPDYYEKDDFYPTQRMAKPVARDSRGTYGADGQGH